MYKALTIAQRELLTHVRKPTFYLATFGLPLLFGGILFIIGMEQSDVYNGQPGMPTLQHMIAEEELQPIGYVDRSGTIVTIPSSFPASFVHQYSSEKAGREALHSGDISALYVLPADYQATGQVLLYTARAGPGAMMGSMDLFELLLVTNLLPDRDPRMALRLQEPMQLSIVTTEQTTTDQGEDISREAVEGLPLLVAIVFAISIFMASGILLQAVVEEKENRTIEIILSSVAPQHFLVGKVLGLGLLGLFQLLIWLGLMRLLVGASAQFMTLLRSSNLSASVILLALLYFILGYLLFAILMAGIGAVSSSVRESSQLSLIVTLPATVPILLMPLLVANPDGGVALGLSLFPLTASIAMIFRLVVASVPVWQIALSLLLLMLAALGAIQCTGKLFRASVLLAGKRPALREIVRALAG